MPTPEQMLRLRPGVPAPPTEDVAAIVPTSRAGNLLVSAPVAVATSASVPGASEDREQQDASGAEEEESDAPGMTPRTKPPEGWRREVVKRRSVAGADVYYHSPCGERVRSRPDVQRFLDRKKKEGVTRYLAVTVTEFDFSSKGVNQRPASEFNPDYLAGTWVYLNKKSEDEAPEKPPKTKQKEEKRRENLTAFEREREERIQRNKEQLAALNIAPLADKAVSSGRGGGAGGGKKRKKEEDGPVRRSLRGLNIPPDAALAGGVDVERRDGTVLLAGLSAGVAAGADGDDGEKAARTKRAPGPYFTFCKEQRPKIVAAAPGASFGEVGKALGAAWKALPDAEKVKYGAKCHAGAGQGEGNE